MSVAAFIEACRAAGLGLLGTDSDALRPATTVDVAAPDWAAAARVARALDLRWAALWADEVADGLRVHCCLEGGGRYLVLRTHVAEGEALPSHTPIYPAADRPERHARDLLGLQLADHPDPRRWTRHAAWPAEVHPLRGDRPLRPEGLGPTPTDHHYPFVQAEGRGIVEIPVGPVHAGIIEPGHFRFQAVGEIVLNLEERLGYVHKGIEKLAVGRDAEGLARLAGRVSGDSTVAHAWAACQALERAAGIEPPPRAIWLRALMAERERIANHLGDIGAICNDVGFAFAQYQLTRLKEAWVRASAAAFGHRLMMDRVVPGGVAVDLAAEAGAVMAAQARALAEEVAAIVAILEDSESLEDRLMTTGRLAPEQARLLGAVGYVGKASGQAFDVRRDAPYAPYDRLPVEVPCYRAGDVAARAKIRADEIGISARLIAALLETLPDGPVRAPWRSPPAPAEGLGIIEGWRGEIITYVRLDREGRVARFFPRDPSWLTWPALELLLQGNIVPDFPVCNKSVNGSYSGQDL
ncbi:NADH-quinone oxidoreductase subunit C [Inmirania thermothiophila]|uniref:Ni,Fe-hydrogenase III large subunit n=1 Tax=Inmirania thermothiophila TaxID=1750597 RepID=A0A3N1XTQ0_9GAMM|nr:NADH-quinone oxidoreductase subunit C [Inmirania thermothiophila]ROR29551.1 Ni,Fe-hydrogenase III large subunit [Inmirania thermothiophila]